jgi:spoIIIJ-associated protein
MCIVAVLEFEGKSVEKAVEIACAELHIPRDRLKYQVISHGSSGIFGLVGTKKALIRVNAPDNDKTAPSKFDQHTGENAFVKREDVTALVNEAFGDDPAAEAFEGEGSAIEETEIEDVEIDDEDIGADASEDDGDEAPVTTDDDMEGLRIAESIIQNIANHMAIDVAVSLRDQTEERGIHISGPDAAVLIGKKGQALEALQYLTDKMVQKQAGRRYRITIDVEGYIETRFAELTALAQRLVEKVIRSGKPSSISRLSAQERRLVHLALKTNKSVRTQSIGDGYYRKLVIFPKKKNHKKTKGKTEQTEQE